MPAASRFHTIGAMRVVKDNLFKALGFTSLSLAVIGIFLPLFPTVPFALLSAYFFSRSSERLYRWLTSLPHIGAGIRDWNEHGVIRLRSKMLAVTAIAATMLYISVFSDIMLAIKIVVASVLTGVTVFILTRPSSTSPAKEE